VPELPDLSTFAEHQNKLTTLVFRKDFKAMNRDCTDYLLETNTATLHYSMLFIRLHPWNQVLIKKVDQLFTAGIIQKLENERNLHKQEAKPDDGKARSLTMDHLGICFATIMICLGLSCIAFVVEWIVGSCF
jgi:hypothetical protein